VTRGYTLIEVVVVLLVLALAAGVVVPAIGRSADTLRLRAEVAGVASFLRAAREQAITREMPYEVGVDSEASVLVLRVSAGDAGQSAPAVRATKRLSPRLRLEADPPSARVITFFPQGLSSGGRFRIEAPGAVVYLVTVDPVTGRVATRRGES